MESELACENTVHLALLVLIFRAWCFSTIYASLVGIHLLPVFLADAKLTSHPRPGALNIIWRDDDKVTKPLMDALLRVGAD